MKLKNKQKSNKNDRIKFIFSIESISIESTVFPVKQSQFIYFYSFIQLFPFHCGCFCCRCRCRCLLTERMRFNWKFETENVRVWMIHNFLNWEFFGEFIIFEFFHFGLLASASSLCHTVSISIICKYVCIFNFFRFTDFIIKSTSINPIPLLYALCSMPVHMITSFTASNQIKQKKEFSLILKSNTSFGPSEPSIENTE